MKNKYKAISVLFFGMIWILFFPFESKAQLPTVITDPATAVGMTSATLNGTINPNSSTTTASFEYGLTTAYGSTINAVPAIITGNTATAIMANITGLNPCTQYHFRAVGTNSYGTAYGSDMTFTSGGTPVPVSITITVSSNPVCSGVVATFTASSVNGGSTPIYQWKVNGVNAGTNTSIFLYFPVNGDVITCTLTSNIPCATGNPATSNSITMTVNPLPFITTTPLSQQIYSGSTTNIILTATLPGTTFTWTCTPSSSNVSGYSAGSGSVINQLLINTGILIETVTYHITPSANGCVGPVTDYIVTVLPSSSSNGTLTGTVRNCITNAPIPGVIVVCDGKSSTTNASGVYTILNVTPGSQTVTATCVGYISFSGIAVIVANQTTIYDFCMNSMLPTVYTNAATAVTSTSASLNGVVYANNLSTTTSFQYGLTSSYGNTVPGVPLTVTGNTATCITASLIGLLPCTTYHFRAVGANAAGTAYGSDLTFSTNGANPAGPISGPANVCAGGSGYIYTVPVIPGATGYVWTVPAGATITSGANTNSITVNFSSFSVSGYISVYGTSSCGNGASSQLFINILACQLPTVITNPATSIGMVTATLNGTINPNSSTTTAFFEFGLTTAYGSTINAIPATITGNTATAIQANITGLSQCTLYHFRAAGTNSYGTAYGNDMTFTSGGSPVPVSITITVSSNPICFGVAATFIAIPVNGGSNPVYQWKVNGINAGSGTSTFTYIPVNGDIITCSLTSNSPCTTGNPAASNPISIIVNPLPFVTTTPASKQICSSNSTNIVLTSNVAGTTFTWTCTPSSSNITGFAPGSGNIINQILVSSGVMMETVTYHITPTANGCVGPVMDYVVTVLPSSSPAISGPSSVCAGSSGVVYTTITGMIGYFWSISSGGTITSGNGTNTITVTWNRAGSEYLKVYCTTSFGCISKQITYPVTILPSPVPTITGASSVCANTTVLYMTEAGKTNYNWSVSPGGFITSGNGTRSITVNWVTPGARIVAVNYTNPNGCSASVPTVKNVSVNPIPSPTITGPNSVCLNALVTYSTEPGMTNYTWAIGGTGGNIYSGFNSNQVLVKWTATGSKWMSVNYTTPKGCRAAAPTIYNVTVHTCPVPQGKVTDIEEKALKETPEFSIYPNPNNGLFTAVIDCSCEENCNLFVFNFLGVKVYEKKELILSGKSEISIDLRTLPAGLYTIVFQNHDQSLFRKTLIDK